MPGSKRYKRTGIDGICEHLRKIMSGKVAGPDNIPSEALKADLAATTKILHILFSKICDEEQVPTDGKEGLLIKMLKKDDLSKCGNYRGITLFSIAAFSAAVGFNMRKTKSKILRHNPACNHWITLDGERCKDLCLSGQHH